MTDRATKIGALDALNESINPATEEKQDDIIEELQDIDLNTDELETKTNSTNELLELILLELKIINVHQESMTDEVVNEPDVNNR